MTEPSAVLKFPPPRADRSEMLAVIVGSIALLAEVRDPIGRTYREGLVRRMKSILERERGR